VSLRVAVLDYEMSNLRSAAKALERLGASVAIARSPDQVGAVDALVLPGDGHFGEAMLRLRSSGLDQVVLDAASREVPVLGICIGLQVLFEASEEAPGTPGLGLLPGTVRRLNTHAKIPHIGWARVRWSERCPLAPADPVDPSTYYFLHSYAVEPADRTSCWGAAEHGVPFCAAAGEGNVMGFQFHPEKSSRSGLALLGRWISHVSAAVAA
jgi:glutamine amidotransferase